MLPSPERLLEGLAFFARRHTPPARAEEEAITAALAEAERLADGREEDEPAALFFACARRSRMFGALAREFIPFVARRHALAAGSSLVADDVVLDILRTRVILGAMTFDELRSDFTERRRART